jgi:hypothetical protein
MISIFPLWTFHLYVATSQQHLHLEYISLRWYDIPELVVPLRCSGRLSSSCSTSGTRRVNLVTNPVISREWGKDREVFTTSGIYLWSIMTQIFYNVQPSHGGDRNIFEVMTSTLPRGILAEGLSSPSVFSGVHVTRSLVLCVFFIDRCWSFCTFSFDHCVVCSSSIYGFWLPPFSIFKLFLLLIS